MAKKKKPVNPFYVALVLIGVAFSVTACGYFVMTLNAMNPVPFLDSPSRADDTPAAEKVSLNAFLSEHGFKVMMIELACLAVATFAAMALDEVRDRRNKQSELNSPAEPPAEEGSPV